MALERHLIAICWLCGLIKYVHRTSHVISCILLIFWFLLINSCFHLVSVSFILGNLPRVQSEIKLAAYRLSLTNCVRLFIMVLSLDVAWSSLMSCISHSTNKISLCFSSILGRFAIFPYSESCHEINFEIFSSTFSNYILMLTASSMRDDVISHRVSACAIFWHRSPNRWDNNLLIYKAFVLNWSILG